MDALKFLDDLQPNFSGEIRTNEPLRFHTGFRMGGPAKLLLIPQGIADLRRTITWAGRKGLPYQIVGNGTSVLAHPDGFPGLIIKLVNVLNHIRLEGSRIYTGAGASMRALLRQAITHNLTGLEDWWGVPSTIGGWFMKLGRANHPLLDLLIQEVYILGSDGNISRWIEPSQLFKAGTAPKRPWIVVEVVFQLRKGEREKILERISVRQAGWRFLTQTSLPLLGPVFLSSQENMMELFVKHELSGLQSNQVAFLGIDSGYLANLGGATYEDVNNILRILRSRLIDSGMDQTELGLCFLNSKEVIEC